MARPERLFDLYHLLSANRVRSIDELAERFDVSKRTVYRDIAALEERYVPIVRDERGVRLMKGATLKPLNLSPSEYGLLRLALEQPALDDVTPLARRRDVLLAKLDAAARPADTEGGDGSLGGPERSGEIDEELFTLLETAIDRRQAIEIDYHSLSGGTRRWRGIDPYALFHRGGAWYVAGRCHEADEPKTFRLDRVAGARDGDASFADAVAAGFELEEYLDGAWGVYRTDERHRIVVRFDAELAPLIENARHLAGEVIERTDDGTIEYRAGVAGLDEIARWIVGFGGAARVVEPAELRERVREIAAGAARANGG